MLNRIIDINEDEFNNNVLNSNINKYFLIKFWAKWCNPCKVMDILLNSIYDEYVNLLVFYKINIDKNNVLSTKYNIRSIPTIILFYKGKVIDTKVGLISKIDIKKFINNKILL